MFGQLSHAEAICSQPGNAKAIALYTFDMFGIVDFGLWLDEPGSGGPRSLGGAGSPRRPKLSPNQATDVLGHLVRTPST